MTKKILTHLMFEDSAEDAMNYYVGLVPGSEVIETQRYEEGENAGKLLWGKFTLAGHEYMCIDSPVPQDFGFTPSMSVFVECESSSELERLFNSLVEGGETLMPPDNYGFSSRFAWLQDRFGLSWQLNLA